MTRLAIVTGRAGGHHILPAVVATAGYRDDVIPSQKLPVLQRRPVTIAVLAAVAVAGEEEGIGDLTAESAGYVNEAGEANDDRTGNLFPLTSKDSGRVDFEHLRLL